MSSGKVIAMGTRRKISTFSSADLMAASSSSFAGDFTKRQKIINHRDMTDADVAPTSERPRA
jgi:hypothetical protein